MHFIKRLLITLVFVLQIIIACTPRASQIPPTLPTLSETPTPVLISVTSTVPVSPPTGFDAVGAMRYGVNIGNALEAPNEGDEGVIIQEQYFDLIKKAGFKTVRIPIRWSAHAADASPFIIDPAFFVRVDEVVKWALAHDLIVIINIHHYSTMMSDPNGQCERFLVLWEQIAEHYKDYSPALIFELLNEPNNELTAPLWNEISGRALDVIRKSNPTRNIIVGPTYWNSDSWMDTLDLPVNDTHLIATFHYYQPFQFTHQGAAWEEDGLSWLGTNWSGTISEKKEITDAFDSVAAWSKEYNRPILLGEFGSYYKADMDSRVRWTEFIAREAESRGFAWTYWEFCSGFGIYDRTTGQFLEPLLKALVP